MRIRRVCLADPLRPRIGTRFYPDDRVCHYLFHVLRLRAGDRVRLFNAQGEWDAAVSAAAGEGLEILAELPRNREARLHVCCLIPPIKGSRFRDAVRMAVEAGADEFIPVLLARCVRRPDNLERLSQEMRDWCGQAAQQCGQTPASILEPARDVEELVRHPSLPPLRLLLSPQAGTPIDVCLQQFSRPPSRLALLSGPEGGISPAEEARLGQAGFLAVRLRTPVLRAETAPAVAVALVRHLLPGKEATIHD